MEYKMPTPKSYVGNDFGSRMARYILSQKRNYRNMGNYLNPISKESATKGRNNPRGAKGAR